MNLIQPFLSEAKQTSRYLIFKKINIITARKNSRTTFLPIVERGAFDLKAVVPPEL